MAAGLAPSCHGQAKAAIDQLVAGMVECTGRSPSPSPPTRRHRHRHALRRGRHADPVAAWPGEPASSAGASVSTALLAASRSTRGLTYSTSTGPQPRRASSSSRARSCPTARREWSNVERVLHGGTEPRPRPSSWSHRTAACSMKIAARASRRPPAPLPTPPSADQVQGHTAYTTISVRTTGAVLVHILAVACHVNDPRLGEERDRSRTETRGLECCRQRHPVPYPTFQRGANMARAAVNGTSRSLPALGPFQYPNTIRASGLWALKYVAQQCLRFHVSSFELRSGGRVITRSAPSAVPDPSRYARDPVGSRLGCARANGTGSAPHPRAPSAASPGQALPFRSPSTVWRHGTAWWQPAPLSRQPSGAVGVG